MANIYATIYPSSQTRQLGERFSVLCRAKNKTGPDIQDVFVSATFDCWDSANNHIVPAFPIVQIQYATNSADLRYMMTTGPAQTITVPGTYRYVFSIKTSDGEVATFEQTALINPMP